LRWLADAEKDLPVIKFPRRRQKTDEREEWAFVVKDAKAVRES